MEKTQFSVSENTANLPKIEVLFSILFELFHADIPYILYVSKHSDRVGIFIHERYYLEAQKYAPDVFKLAKKPKHGTTTYISFDEKRGEAGLAPKVNEIREKEKDDASAGSRGRKTRTRKKS